MAVIQGDFDPEVIRKFRGVLDYYYYRGLLVVRSWPRKPVLPRSPAVQATASDFRDTARALSALPLDLRATTTELVKDTAWTWRDAWTSALYGHNIEWPEPEVPPPVEDEENMLIVRLQTTQTGGSGTTNVNSTTYVFCSQNQALSLDTAKFMPTNFRLLMWGRANQAGQTITAQLARSGSPGTPVSAAGDDIVMTNTLQLWDSGWLAFNVTLSGIENLILGLKGSNASVDYEGWYTELQLWHPPA